MYLTYSEYTGMGGQLTQKAFDRFNARAQALISSATHGRVEDEKTVREGVRYAAFDVIEAMRMDAENGADTHEIASMSNDGASISYATTGENPATANRRRYLAIVRDYLLYETDREGTPLLYAGVDA